LAPLDSGHPHFDHHVSFFGAAKEYALIVLGIILIVVGYLLPVPAIIATIGWILLVIGIVLLVLGRIGRPVGGRRYWY
jgi:membrane-bound ClpP family serine protease